MCTPVLRLMRVLSLGKTFLKTIVLNSCNLFQILMTKLSSELYSKSSLCFSLNYWKFVKCLACLLFFLCRMRNTLIQFIRSFPLFILICIKYVQHHSQENCLKQVLLGLKLNLFQRGLWLLAISFNLIFSFICFLDV